MQIVFSSYTIEFSRTTHNRDFPSHTIEFPIAHKSFLVIYNTFPVPQFSHHTQGGFPINHNNVFPSYTKLDNAGIFV